MTTRHPATFSGGIVGAGLGLAVGGLLVLFLHGIGGLAPDAPVTSDQSSSGPPSTAAQLGVAFVSTSIGALIGAIVGHRMLTTETFEFGDSHQLESSSLSR